MTGSNEREKDRRSAVKLICGFSACVFLAGWAPALDPAVRNFWMSAGLVGLVAALVVQSVQAGTWHLEQPSAASEQPITSAKGHERAERGDLERMMDHSVRTTGLLPERRRAVRQVVDWPVQMTTATAATGDGMEMGQSSTTAIVRDISLTGVRIEHREPITTRKLTLLFDGEDGAPFSMLVELVWSNLKADDTTYFSGGRILTVEPVGALTN